MLDDLGMASREYGKNTEGEDREPLSGNVDKSISVVRSKESDRAGEVI